MFVNHMQLRTSALHKGGGCNRLCGGGGRKEGAEEEERESDRDGGSGREGEGEESSQTPDRSNAPAKERCLTMHACSQSVGCRC